MRKSSKGITLIALIITIIILLILAGVTIAQLTESGLFNKAKLAEQKSENAQLKEELTLGEYENTIGEYINGTRNVNANNYSTNETEIGTWIDGSKIYRKTFETVTPSNLANPLIDISQLNIKKVVDVYGMLERADGYVMPINVGYNNADCEGGWFDNEYTKICFTTNFEGYKSQKIWLSIEYIK